jgi:hypothetical protein
MSKPQKKRSLHITLVLLTSSAVLMNLTGCQRRHDDDEREIGGGAYYHNINHSWTGRSYHYRSYRSFRGYGSERSGFGSSGHGFSGG